MRVRLERSMGMFESFPEDTPELPETVEYEFPVWVQLTYNELRLPEDGEMLAVYTSDGKGDGWWLTPSERAIEQFPQLANADTVYPFSDIIIAA